MKNFKEYFLLFIKGMGMGAANVIPGVSGGTIALITGIFERLIDSIKSFDLTAVQLLFKFRLKEFFRHTDFFFLTAVLGGAVVSVFSLAKLLEFLFANYPIFVWSFSSALSWPPYILWGKQLKNGL
jgi:putative membrane protein